MTASLERWVTSRASWSRDDRSVEDNTFDYSYPVDPWENLGAAAQFFGAGYLFLGLGVYALLRAAPSSQTGRMRVVTLIAGGSFVIDGGHALVSGVLDSPSLLQHIQVLQWVVSLVAWGCLIVLGALWLRSSWAVSLACFCLLGVTVPGYLWAMYALAPLISGYQSHDTTPWTETIVAGLTAAAGVALVLAAALLARTRARASEAQS